MKRLFLTLPLLGVSLMGFAGEMKLPFSGSGTEEDPYIISTANDIVTLANACNAEKSINIGHYDGKYFKLTADIDMSEVKNFIGIGTAPKSVASSVTYYFGGNFDGQGHKITNMTINGLATDIITGGVNTGTGANQSRANVGFFGTLRGAEVKNLIIDSSCSIRGINCVGGVAGNVLANNASIPPTIVSNCVNNATVTAVGNHAGGIAGQVSCTNFKYTAIVSDCLNNGTITTNADNVGGIVGNANFGQVSLCANTGTVQARNLGLNPSKGQYSPKVAGGILGNGKATLITNCINYGDVYSAADKVGGIAAYNYISNDLGEITGCVNVGSVYTEFYSSGYILGSTTTSATTQMPDLPNCYYDAQMLNANLMAPRGACFTREYEVGALTTAQLTNGTLPKNLNSEIWTATKGYYPMLNKFKDNANVKAAASAFINLPAGQNAADIMGSATLNSATPGATMSAAAGTPESIFSISGSEVKFANNSQPQSGTILIKNGDFSRTVILTTIPNSLDGKGTAADPYLIKTGNDLAFLANTSNKKIRCHWEGAHFKLANDIDMSGITDFHGIANDTCTYSNVAASYQCYFSGILDGDNHKISNLNINNVVFSESGVYENFMKGSYYITGLFGVLGSNATVSNLILDNTCKIVGIGMMGGICGYQNSGLANLPVKITNCHVAAEIISYGGNSGGLYGYCDSKGPVEIRNCTYSGTMINNSRYAAGIAAMNTVAGSVIANCANLGSITVKSINGSSLADVQRVAGITCVGLDSIYNCVNYGPITVETLPTTTKVDGVGGIQGQTSNSNKGMTGTLVRNLNFGQIYIKTPNPETVRKDICAMVGYNYYVIRDDNGACGLNFNDSTLVAVTELYGSSNQTDSTWLANREKNFTNLPTSAFTSGTPIKGLEEAYVFERGYYPMPKGLENMPAVRAAAATYFKVPEGQSVRGIKSGETCYFNNRAELVGTLESDQAFEIKDNAIFALQSKEDLSDLLTLRNGSFYNIYPLIKLAGDYTGIEEIASESEAEIVETVYLNLQGQRVAEPEEGAVTIAIVSFADGSKKVAKIVK